MSDQNQNEPLKKRLRDKLRRQAGDNPTIAAALAYFDLEQIDYEHALLLMATTLAVECNILSDNLTLSLQTQAFPQFILIPQNEIEKLPETHNDSL